MFYELFVGSNSFTPRALVTLFGRERGIWITLCGWFLLRRSNEFEPTSLNSSVLCIITCLLKQESPVPRANELKSGMVVEINGAPHSVKNVDAKSPSSRGASTLYKVRFTNLKTGQKLDESYKGEDMLKERSEERRVGKSEG